MLAHEQVTIRHTAEDSLDKTVWLPNGRLPDGRQEVNSFPWQRLIARSRGNSVRT